MKNIKPIVLALAAAGFTSSAYAGAIYQATGPVLEVTNSKIVIQKNNETWEIARSTDTKITGDLKVGSKVTIQYTMSAASVEVKPDKVTPAKTAVPPVPKKTATKS
jgi:hypothetical protein